MKCNCPNMATLNNGNNTTHHVSNCTINGNNLKVYGNYNKVNGNNNKIYGDFNKCTGNNLKVDGEGNSVSGNNNKVSGAYNRVNGNNNKTIITKGSKANLKEGFSSEEKQSFEILKTTVTNRQLPKEYRKKYTANGIDFDNPSDAIRELRNSEKNKETGKKRKWDINIKLSDEEYQELEEYMESVKYLWEIR